MIKINTKTLSLQYDIVEDRMKLIINKDDVDTISFWITRRFYFSLLFELEVFMDKLSIPYDSLSTKGITYEKKQKPIRDMDKQNIPSTASQNSVSKHSDKTVVYTSPTISETTLLQNVNIKYIKQNNTFLLYFRTSSIEAQSTFNVKTLQDFYMMLKTTFPKIEWGSY